MSGVFVDIDGDKYLATIVNTIPPGTLASSSNDPLSPHAFASDLNMAEDELNKVDDPMEYTYNVRLVERGTAQDVPLDYAGSNPQSEELQKIVEIHARDITCVISPGYGDSADARRLHFSKMMLKRFLRDCVHREAAVYSPWLLKASVAERYGLPTEMSDAVKDRIQTYRERQMDRRKREREERMGLTHPSEMETTEDEKPKTKKSKKEEVVQVEEEEAPKIKKAVIKYPIDGELSNPDMSHS
jgi:bromodomain adjacent to zinc finger domain protein 1A